jgi:hypothetical protein
MRNPLDKLEMETVGALAVQPPLDIEIVRPGTRVPDIVGKAVFSRGLETRDLGSPDAQACKGLGNKVAITMRVRLADIEFSI